MWKTRAILALSFVAGAVTMCACIGSVVGVAAMVLPRLSTDIPAPVTGLAQPPAPTPAGVVATQPSPTAKPVTTAGQQPTQPATATPTVAAARQALVVVSSGFGQRARNVGFGFMLENPNAGFALERSQYQVAIYNDAGAVLQTQSGTLAVILPSQRVGVSGSVNLPEGIKAARLEVQVSAGSYVASAPVPAYTSGQVDYRDDGSYAEITAVITSPYTADSLGSKLSAIAFDAAGKIIGSGSDYVNLIPARSSTGVTAAMWTSSKPARVEVYAHPVSLAQLTAPAKLAGQPAQLVTQGYGQSGSRIGVGFLMKNPNPDMAIDNVPFRVTAYAPDGRVLEVEEGGTPLLLPNQQLGIAAEVNLPANTTLGRLIVQTGPGTITKSDPLPAFTADKITYMADKSYPKVTGVITSPYSKDMKSVQATAIGYDAAGKIIGSGEAYLDFVPANGTAAVSMYFFSAGIPANVEVYAALPGLYSFQQ